MNLVTKLFYYSWIQGIIMISLVGLILVFIKLYNKNNPEFKLSAHDKLIQSVVVIIFYSIPFIAQFALGIRNTFWFTIIFSISGVICEYCFSLVWLKFMGSRIYAYLKYDINGFTSLLNFPYWGACGLYFYGVWQFIEYITQQATLKNLNIGNTLLTVFFISILTLISILFVTILNLKFNIKKSTFTLKKYSFIAICATIPVIYLIIALRNLNIAIYFIFSSIMGLIIEGILANVLTIIYGENLWIYYRYTIFKKGTSLLILPLWGTAVLLAFFLFYFLFVN